MIFCTHVYVWLLLSSKKDLAVRKRFLDSLEKMGLFVLPGLWSITQVVVETAALWRAGTHGSDKFTCGHIEPQEQEKEHFGQLLRIRSLPTCAWFAHTKYKKTPCLSFTLISSAWLSPTTSLSHSDRTAMSPQIKKDRQGLVRGLAFFSSGCALHPGIR